MRYAKLYLSDQLVDALSPGLSTDQQLRVICPNCSSPLTFLQTADGKKYFRHPRRTLAQIESPDFQCEARVGLLKPAEVIRYNGIIQKTTLKQFQDNYLSILGTVLEIDIDREIALSQSREARQIFEILEKISTFIKAKVNSSLDENTLVMINRMNEMNIDEKYDWFAERDQDVNEEDPSKFMGYQFLYDPASYLIFNWVSEIKLLAGPRLSDADQLMARCSDETKASRLKHLKDNKRPHLYVMEGLMRMLMNDRSVFMRRLSFQIGAKAKWRAIQESFPDVAKTLVNTDPIRRTSVFGRIFCRLEEGESIDLSSELAIRKVTLQDALVINASIAHLLVNIDIDIWLNAIKVAESQRINNIQPESGFIYIAYDSQFLGVKNDFPVKIGKTQDPLSRLSSYKTYSPDGFLFEKVWPVINYHAAERYILKHKRLRPYRCNTASGGKEWFNLNLHHAVKIIGELVNEHEAEQGVFALPKNQQNGCGFA